MTDVLPTLAREWASLGASNAPKTVVRRDSPRIAAALNTFASFVNAEKKVYISVRRRADPGTSEWAPDQCVPRAQPADAVSVV